MADYIKCHDCAQWKLSLGPEPNDIICLYNADNFETHECNSNALAFRNQHSQQQGTERGFCCAECPTAWMVAAEMQHHIDVYHGALTESNMTHRALIVEHCNDALSDNNSARSGDSSLMSDTVYTEDIRVEQYGGWIKTSIDLHSELQPTVNVIFNGGVHIEASSSHIPTIKALYIIPTNYSHPENDSVFIIKRIAVLMHYKQQQTSTPSMYLPIRLSPHVAATTVISIASQGVTANDMDPPHRFFAEEVAENVVKAFSLYTDGAVSSPKIQITGNCVQHQHMYSATVIQQYNNIIIPMQITYENVLEPTAPPIIHKAFKCDIYSFVERENTFVDRFLPAQWIPDTTFTSFWNHVPCADRLHDSGVLLRTAMLQINGNPCRMSCKLDFENYKVTARYFGCIITYTRTIPALEHLRVPVRFRSMHGPTSYKLLINAVHTPGSTFSAMAQSLSFDSMLTMTRIPANIYQLQFAAADTTHDCSTTKNHNVVSVRESEQTHLCVCPKKILNNNVKYTLLTVEYYIAYSFRTPMLHDVVCEPRHGELLTTKLAACNLLSTFNVERPLRSEFPPIISSQQCTSGFDHRDRRNANTEIWLFFSIPTDENEVTVAIEKNRSVYFDGNVAIDGVKTTRGKTIFPPSTLTNSRGQIFQAVQFAGIAHYSDGADTFLPILFSKKARESKPRVREIMPKPTFASAMAEAVRHSTVIAQPFRIRVYNPRTQTSAGRIGIQTVVRRTGVEHFVPRSFKRMGQLDYNCECKHLFVKICFQLTATITDCVDAVYRNLPPLPRLFTNNPVNALVQRVPPVFTEHNIYGNALLKIGRNLYRVRGFEDSGPLPMLHKKWTTFGLPITTDACRVIVADGVPPLEQPESEILIPYTQDGCVAAEWVALVHYCPPSKSANSLWVVVTAPETKCALQSTAFTCRRDYATDLSHASSFAQYCACKFSGQRLERKVAGTQEHKSQIIKCYANIPCHTATQLVQVPHQITKNNITRTCRTVYIMIRYEPDIIYSPSDWKESLERDGNYAKRDYKIPLTPTLINVYGQAIETDEIALNCSMRIMRDSIPEVQWMSVRIQFGDSLWLVVMADYSDANLEYVVAHDELAAHELAIGNPFNMLTYDSARIMIKHMAMEFESDNHGNMVRVSHVRHHGIYDLLVPAKINGLTAKCVTVWLKFRTVDY